MAPVAFKTVYLFFALVALPQVLAGPGCARRNYGKPDCVEKCKSGWGVAGHYMGRSKWGPVVNVSNSTDLDSIISVACGLNQTSSTSGPEPIPTDEPSSSPSSPPPANGYEPTPSVPNPSDPSYSPPPPPISSTDLNSSTSPTPGLPSSPPPPPPASTSSSPSSPPVNTNSPSPTSSPAQNTPPTSSSTTPSSPTPSPSPKVSSNTSSTPTISDTSSIQDETLTGHNNYRALHGASPLTWSDDLAATAQTWVSKCVFKHSGGPYGENLAAGTGVYTVTDAINDWTSEASSYDPNNPVFSHFTQVVWKGTTQVGCAVVTCPAGSIFDASYGTSQFVACEYNPPGNVDGEFAQNVQV